MKKISIFFIIIMFSFLNSCIYLVEELKLNSNLSGDIKFYVSYDIKKIVNEISKVQLQGKKISSQMKKMIELQVNQNIEKGLLNEKEIKNKLPKGIKLKSFRVKRDKGKFIFIVKLHFKHIKYLEELKNFTFNKMTGQMKQNLSMMGQKNTSPLKNLRIIKKNNIIEIFNFSQEEINQFNTKCEEIESNKIAKSPSNLPPFLKKEHLKKIIKGVIHIFKIKMPYKKYKVIKHNAHKYSKSKHTLYWYYSYKQYKKLKKKGKILEPVHVVLKKK